jgi:hypothetical protein
MPTIANYMNDTPMGFGKYKNEPLGEVVKSDPSYIHFLALKSDWEPDHPVHRRMMEHIRATFHKAALDAEHEKFDRIKARDASRADLPAFQGRTTIEGTVISTKWIEFEHVERGGRPGVLKMLVEHDTGWRVWGSVPQELAIIDLGSNLAQRILIRGDRIRFDAAVSASPKDPKFGFFSRPTKATLLKAGGGM